VTRKVFVRLDCAANPSGIVGRNKIASVPRASAIVVAKSATAARIGADTGSLSGLSIFRVGHVCAAAPETREVDARPAACDRKGVAALMILLLLFLQKQSLAFAVYLFGIGTLLTGLGS
jgi:hypothetical protein